MREMNELEIVQVGGGHNVSDDAIYSASLGIAGGLLAIGLTVTAPVWGTAALIGGSIAASGIAISYVWK